MFATTRSFSVCPSDAARGPRSQSGFTLLEILLAVAILATVSAFVAMSFSTTFRVADTIGEEETRERTARSALSVIIQDLTTARAQTGSPWMSQNGDLNGQPADVLAFASTGRGRSRSNKPESELTRVLYARDGPRLLRYEIMNPYVFTPEAAVRVELAQDVAGFNLRYYDRSVKSWLDVWEGQGRVGLPMAVLVELTILNGRKESRMYSAYVMIPSQAS